MDELVLVMKEINSKITGAIEDSQKDDDKKESACDKMYMKAECCNEKNTLRGNPVKILLNNFPMVSNKPFSEKERIQEKKNKEDFIDFYQDLKLNLRNKLHPEFAFKYQKAAHKTDKELKRSVGDKRQSNGLRKSFSLKDEHQTSVDHQHTQAAIQFRTMKTQVQSSDPNSLLLHKSATQSSSNGIESSNMGSLSATTCNMQQDSSDKTTESIEGANITNMSDAKYKIIEG